VSVCILPEKAVLEMIYTVSGDVKPYSLTHSTLKLHLLVVPMGSSDWQCYTGGSAALISL